MANIALDIKANTSKALGEFKKLSRELDNKFLVQGLKLDVVKNAFRQINREFEQSLGNQGFKTSETTNQLQRNAAANLAILNKMSFEAASQVTRDVKKNLQGLQAEAKITGDVVKESLVAASFFDFSGSEEDVKRQFQSFANQFATVSQDLNDSFGKSGAGDFQKVLTGQASIESLYGLDFGQGGATSNLLQKAIRDNYGNIDAVTGEARTALINRILKDFQDVNTDVGAILQQSKQQAKIDDPFRFINREISSLFSPRGVFGSLREIGESFTSINGQENIPRNVLQLTAELIRTIFDKDKGLFATLAKSLGEVFGFETENVLEPILRGIEFLTGALTSLRDFLASPQFKKFLGIFKPLADAIRGIDTSKISFDVETIKGFVGKIGETIREIFNKAASFIRNLDTSAISDVLGTIIGELVKTIPSLLNLVFSSLGKVVGLAFDTVNKSGPGAALIYAALTTGAVNFIDKIFGGPGIIGRLKNVFANTIGRSFSKLAASLGLGARAGLGGGRNTRTLNAGDRLFQSRNVGFQTGVTTRLNTIIRLLGGSAPLDPSGRGRGGPRRGAPGRDGRTASQRARSINRIRRSRRITGITSRIPGLRQLRSAQLASSFLRGAPRLPGASILSQGQGPSVGRLPGDYRNIPNRNNARIGSPAGLFQERAPRIPTSPRLPRIPTTPITRAGGGILSRLSGVGSRAAGAARGLGRRIPLLGTLLAGVSIASILGGPGAKAEELEGLTPEEKREQRRQENRQKTRGVLGVLGGVAGGAAGGAALGTLVGGPVGTILGGIIGGIVGEEAVKLLSDPIIDGVTSFAGSIGNWFSGAWSNISSGWNSATKSIGDFFGEEGPIQRFGRFTGDNIKGGVQNIQNFFGEEGPIQSAGRWFGELGGKIMGKIEEAWNGLIGTLTDIPGAMLTAAIGPIFGPLLSGLLKERREEKKAEQQKDSDVNFSGGFNYIGGRNSFNEYEGFRMPDGVTFIPITGSTSLANLSSSSGRSNETTNNISITVNGSENPQEVARQVVTILDTEYSISSNQATT